MCSFASPNKHKQFGIFCGIEPFLLQQKLRNQIVKSTTASVLCPGFAYRAMPKVKIGEKVVAGEANNERRDFNDGHKSFNSFEAAVLVETQQRERRSLEAFEKNKEKFFRPRNPILGDSTPREKVDAKGVVLERTGELLFQTKAEPVEQTRPLTGRPFTGRSLNSSRLSARTANLESFDYEREPPNPLKRTDAKAERISSLQVMQDNISGELEFLKAKILEKQQRLEKMKPTTRF